MVLGVITDYDKLFSNSDGHRSVSKVFSYLEPPCSRGKCVIVGEKKVNRCELYHTFISGSFKRLITDTGFKIS